MKLIQKMFKYNFPANLRHIFFKTNKGGNIMLKFRIILAPKYEHIPQESKGIRQSMMIHKVTLETFEHSP